MAESESKTVGISLGGGNAAAFPIEGIPAIIALAEAAEATAEAISLIARRFEGTPAVQGATISGCNIHMNEPPVAALPKKPAPKKKRRG